MVSVLRPFRPTARDVTKKLHGRFYGAAARRPVIRPIYTQSNATGRIPRLDLVLSGAKLQPYIHDAIATIIRHNKAVQFHIFVKNHKLLKRNGIIARWTNGPAWRGDILVMRVGTKDALVNMRASDAALADFAVRRFTEIVKQKPHFYIPKGLVFRMP